MMVQGNALMLTVGETAVELKLSKSYVKKLVARGALASVKIGRARRIRRADLERYVAALKPLGPDGVAGTDRGQRGG